MDREGLKNISVYVRNVLELSFNLQKKVGRTKKDSPRRINILLYRHCTSHFQINISLTYKAVLHMLLPIKSYVLASAALQYTRTMRTGRST